ncbi:MAG: NTP transferase domain-containing protein [Oscillospiraceae bacterium]|nr:NTP transferase domain-containing protein [Oscillospiraceae bacterium]
MKLGKVGGIIAAASRKVVKPLLRVGEISIIRRIVITYQQAGIFPIVVITGAEEAEVKKQLSSCGVIFLQNKQLEQPELMDSVRLGLRYLAGKCERVAFTPVNVPMFTPATVSSLMQTEGDLVVPSFRGKGGHPVLLSDRIIPQILNYDGADGLRGAMNACGADRVWVDVDDRGITASVNDENELRERLKEHNSAILHPVLHMRLEREVPFFSDRVKLLLFLLADTENMRASCALSGIARSKAWVIINNLEQTLGCRIVERSRGGKSGGSTKLTEAGLDFYLRYLRFESSVQQFAQAEFKREFAK